MAIVVFGFGVVAALALFVAARYRARRYAPIPEAVPCRTVGELSAGRFRVRGRVIGIETTSSALDGAPCVFLEQAEYRTVGSELVPLLREVGHRTVSHPFYLEDASGWLLVDPGETIVEAVTLHEDQGLSAERRLRAGEEVEIVATFAPSEADAAGGPYRAGRTAWRPVADACGPPRLTYRTEPDMVVAGDEVAAFLRGAAVFTFVLTALLGSLSLL